MQTLHARVGGLDVHQRTVVVCVRITSPQGQVREEVRTFGTMTEDLLQLFDWLAQCGVTHVAMESTGVLWKPIWNILEAGEWELLLVNPGHMSHVPGRKSDVKDCQWIAQLLACGLLKSSFVPTAELREVRDLTRQRAQLTGECTRCVNRIHKVLQDANLKLTSVLTDVMGVSGREMLKAMIAGEDDPEKLAERARGKLRNKLPELRRALRGRLTKHHRFLLQQMLAHLEHLEEQVAAFSTQIEEALRPFLSPETLNRLDAIPGFSRRTIENVVVEIGFDMQQFPSAQHLASWAGLCPGNEESAGKRKRSRTTKGSVWLRRALSQAAWAAIRKKDSYFGAQYRRLAGKRGAKRAIVAVAHSLLVVIYHLLKYPDKEFRDLGADYFAKLEPQRTQRQLVKRLERLGFQVTLTPKTAA